MTDKPNNNFHEIALQSVLFKGRPDLYFCYLKSERLAHAISYLIERSSLGGHDVSEMLIRGSTTLPGMIVRFAAHEYDEEALLADLFEVLSVVRLSASNQIIEDSNAELLISEYEGIAEKITLRKHASPFLSLEDLTVPSLGAGSHTLPPRYLRPPTVKDIHGHAAPVTARPPHASASSVKDTTERERTAAILAVVSEKKRVSIKDISKVIKDCSEKTIQRELNVLIARGIVRKEGERRWSVYIPNK